MLKNKITFLDINNKNIINYLRNITTLENKIKNFNNLEKYSKNIIYNIYKFKEKALIFYLNKFEKRSVKKLNDLIVDKNILEKSFYKLDNQTRFVLESSKNRICFYHEEQFKNISKSWKIVEESGCIMGQKMNSIENLGFYIPGGKAVYPSSVFMNLIPAIVCGIDNLTICSPKRINNNLIYSSIFLIGVKRMHSIGGIHALSSMVFGNRIIKKVDKICGPGNIYINIAKKILFGFSGIDSLAGPSEITILADGTTNIETLTMDLLSQAEHDNLAQSILVTNDYNILNKVESNLKKIIPFLYRKKLVYNSVLNNLVLIKLNNFNEFFNIINYLSSEHLIISLNNSYEFFKNVRNSGSIFLGKNVSESFGDYTSGLNHIIPTNKNSRFISPLGAYNFIKKSNFLKLNKTSFNKIFNQTIAFAKKEKLYSHSESVDLRK